MLVSFMYSSNALASFNFHEQEVDRFIDHKAALDTRKKQMLFKKWSERVYSPVKVIHKLVYVFLLLFERTRK